MSSLSHPSAVNGRDVDPRLLSLPFDGYERYRLTAEVMELVWLDAPPPRVLDVGGRSSTLKLLRPADEVVIADPQAPPAFAYRPSVPFAFDRYVVALGGNLPFRDRSFDLVTAHDTLEHVPPDERDRFIEDVVRVSDRFVILNGPVGSPEALDAERRVAGFWERALGEPQHALVEHLRHGLPGPSFVEDRLRAAGLAFVAVPNGNVLLWLVTMAVKSHLQGLPHAEEAHEALDRAFNAEVAPRDFGGPCYRVLYAAARDPEDGQALERVRSAFAGRASRAAAISDREVVGGLVDSLEAHVRSVREDLAEISHLRDVLEKSQVHIRNLEAMIADLRAQVDAANAPARDAQSERGRRFFRRSSESDR